MHDKQTFKKWFDNIDCTGMWLQLFTTGKLSQKCLEWLGICLLTCSVHVIQIGACK